MKSKSQSGSMQSTIITLDDREYTVLQWEQGHIKIFGTRRAINPSNKWTTKQEIKTVRFEIIPTGEVGKKILKALRLKNENNHSC